MKLKKTKRSKLIGNIIYAVVMLFISAIVIFMVIARSQNRIIFIFDRALIWVLSPSMEDTIPAQSYILIKKANASEIKINDIIMFYSDDPSLGGTPNTHRVIEVNGNNDSFITKGDNNQVSDTYTAKADKVIGVYEKNLPVFTSIMRFFLSKVGLIILISSFIVLTTLMYLPNMIKSKKQEFLNGQINETKE